MSTSPSLSSLAHVNRKTLVNLRSLALEGEPDPLPEFIGLFLEDTPTRLAQIAAAIRTNDPRALESAAHSLKGSAGSLGAERLVGLCSNVMICASKDDFRAASLLMAELDLEFQAVRQILVAERDSK